jgi:hypothetical protein
MKPTIALIALLGAVFTGTACAASLDVVIGKLNAEAEACGVSEPQLASAARLALRNNQVQPTENSRSRDSLYVYASVLSSPEGLCVAQILVQINVRVQIVAGSNFTPPKSKDSQYAPVCTEPGLLYGPNGSFAPRVGERVAALIKQCLGHLKY